MQHGENKLNWINSSAGYEYPSIGLDVDIVSKASTAGRYRQGIRLALPFRVVVGETLSYHVAAIVSSANHWHVVIVQSSSGRH